MSFHLTGNQADAQDLAQEAFIRVYLGLGSFRQEADFGTWLYRVTVNVWMNMKRQKEAQVLLLDNPLQTESGEISRTLAAEDPAGNPVEALERKELRQLVRDALWKLPAELRAALVLREMEGYTYKEIAEMVECSLGTVKSRLNRARRILKEKIGPLIGQSSPDKARCGKRFVPAAK